MSSLKLDRKELESKKCQKKGCETVKFRGLLWVVNGKAEKNRSQLNCIII